VVVVVVVGEEEDEEEEEEEEGKGVIAFMRRGRRVEEGWGM